MIEQIGGAQERTRRGYRSTHVPDRRGTGHCGYCGGFVRFKQILREPERTHDRFLRRRFYGGKRQNFIPGEDGAASGAPRGLPDGGYDYCRRPHRF